MKLRFNQFRNLFILLIMVFNAANINGQDEYLEITKYPRKISSLGGGQQFTDKWPIPQLPERFRTTIFRYLYIIQKIVSKKYSESDTGDLMTMIDNNNYKNESWSCDLVKHWSKQRTMNEKKIISQLNSLICPD